MTDPIIGGFEAKKHAYRQTQDGVVVSFVIHPDDVHAAFAVAPLGTPFKLAFESIDYDNPVTATELGQEPPAAKPKIPWADRSPTWRAGVLCKDAAFQQWALGIDYWNDDPTLAETRTKHWVYKHAGVTSRADIKLGSPAAEKWAQIETAFAEDTGRMAERRTG